VSAPRTLVFRPAPTLGIGLAALLCGGFGVPGMILEPSLRGVPFLLGGLAAAGLFVLFGRVRRELSFDPGARVLRLRVVRWPLPPTERELPAASLDSVSVVEGYKQRLTLDLLLAGGEVIALRHGDWGFDRAPYEEARQQLRAWLG
jgi:hypothetical protein